MAEIHELFVLALSLVWFAGATPEHLDFTKDPRPLYYKTPPCVFYQKNVCGKADKKSVVLVKRENGFTKTIPWTENPGKIRRRAFLVNPFSRFTKMTDHFTKILGLKGKGS